MQWSGLSWILANLEYFEPTKLLDQDRLQQFVNNIYMIYNEVGMSTRPRENYCLKYPFLYRDDILYYQITAWLSALE